MVHKKFEKTTCKKESTWIDRSPNPSARNYLDEMAPINGFHQENAEALRLRDAFRDEVSKRMGELLLKGQTMLDEYCQTCSGILMEDRAGVRRCITCELYQEKLSESSHVIPEVPLEPEDLKEAVDATPIPTPPPAENPAPKSTSANLQKAVVKKTNLKKVVEKSERDGSSNAITSAKDVVLEKLEWASAELQSTTEVARVIEFLTVVQKCAETLQSLQI